eukprot:157589_1
MNTDSIPLISQGKSLYQLIRGNKIKARQIQSTFSKQCILVSQIRSAVEAIGGDVKAAKKTQDEFTSSAPLISQLRSTIEVSIGKTKDAIKTQEKYINNLISKNKNKIKLNISKDTTKHHNKNLKIAHKDTKTKEYNTNKQLQTTQENIIDVPDEFICPITWEIMDNPVICNDGNTYERIAITDWLNKHDTSPKTNMPLDDNKLIPNRALKYMIEAWKNENCINNDTKMIHTDHNNVITQECVEYNNGIGHNDEIENLFIDKTE